MAALNSSIQHDTCKMKGAIARLMTPFAALGVILLMISIPGHSSAEPAADDSQWQSCLGNLQLQAAQSGVSDQTITQVFTSVEALPRVISQDRSQAEFNQTFTQYYQARVTERRVKQGRTLAQEHNALLASVSKQSGVPTQYLLSLWGLETNFGSYFGNLSLPSALATLACDARRSTFFTRELMATLHIVDDGDIPAEQLVGSWAGAIGHMQFMPTTYREHAIDGDGDGRKDLLGSIPDALSSGAAYLADLGWQPGFRWGREVVLPSGFDYSNTGSHQWQPLSFWADLGVKDTAGRTLPSLALSSALLLPSGHTGPAFLVYPNFKIIMKWNRSESYALSVGRLADRIAGAGRLFQPLPSIEDNQLSRTAVIQLQNDLNALGFDAGKADGILGPGTRKAVQAYQSRYGMLADGYPTEDVFEQAKAAALSLRDQ